MSSETRFRHDFGTPDTIDTPTTGILQFSSRNVNRRVTRAMGPVRDYPNVQRKVLEYK